jgi:HTH-like domain
VRGAWSDWAGDFLDAGKARLDDGGRQALELEFLKGGLRKRTPAEKRDYIRHHRPRGLSIAEGCRLMGLPRSTYYDVASREADDAEIVATMVAICDEFEAYGYRRVGAELRHRGIVVNSKKIRLSSSTFSILSVLVSGAVVNCTCTGSILTGESNPSSAESRSSSLSTIAAAIVRPAMACWW